MREEILEGEDHEDWRVRFEGFDRVREWISIAEELESESNTARTTKRSKAERGGSQRRASMYLESGSLWTWRVSGVPFTAIARVL